LEVSGTSRWVAATCLNLSGCSRNLPAACLELSGTSRRLAAGCWKLSENFADFYTNGGEWLCIEGFF